MGKEITGQTDVVRGANMSDGREEREESKKRIEEEKRENRDDRIDEDGVDEWEPERVDS
jgi:hypothetical protein